MAATTSKLSFDTTFDARTGTPVPIAPGVTRLTAPNAGPFTFKGTNTYVLGTERIAIVDPGPMSIPHLNALMGLIGGRPIEAVILTHTHKDHCAVVAELGEKVRFALWFGGKHRTSRPKRAFEMDWVARDSDYDVVPDRVLRDGERIAIDGIELEVIATPGHCANHLCFGIAGTDWLLSGDHVMGWNSTMIAVPDGSMSDYLQSLTKLVALPYRRYLPGHGGPILDGPDFARALRGHREARNRQVIDAVARGAKSIAEVVRALYPDLALALIPAARMTIKAHVEYLEDKSLIAVRRGLFGMRLGPVAPAD